jgi:hypothetical protein
MAVYMVGNRVDLGEDMRQVTQQEAIHFVKDNQLDNFFETSARTGHNVMELF